MCVSLSERVRLSSGDMLSAMDCPREEREERSVRWAAMSSRRAWGKEGGREGGREGGKEGAREGEREGGRVTEGEKI